MIDYEKTRYYVRYQLRSGGRARLFYKKPDALRFSHKLQEDPQVSSTVVHEEKVTVIEEWKK